MSKIHNESATFKFEEDADGDVVLVIIPIDVRCKFADIAGLETFVATAARALSEAKARAGMKTGTPS